MYTIIVAFPVVSNAKTREQRPKESRNYNLVHGEKQKTILKFSGDKKPWVEKER